MDRQNDPPEPRQVRATATDRIEDRHPVRTRSMKVPSETVRGRAERGALALKGLVVMRVKPEQLDTIQAETINPEPEGD